MNRSIISSYLYPSVCFGPKCHCKFLLGRCICLRRVFSHWTILRCSIHRDHKRTGLSHGADPTANFLRILLPLFIDLSMFHSPVVYLGRTIPRSEGLLHERCMLPDRDRGRPSKHPHICLRWTGLLSYWFTLFLLYLKHALVQADSLAVVRLLVDFIQF